jgi:hypothetical protein
VGRPAAPIPVSAPASLAASAKRLPGRAGVLLLSWLWSNLSALLFPSRASVAVVFVFWWRADWPLAKGFLVVLAICGAAWMSVLLWVYVICRWLGAGAVLPTSDPRRLEMFSWSWFAFHVVDMSLHALHDGDASFFGSSEVWVWLLRWTGARVVTAARGGTGTPAPAGLFSRILVVEPFLNEPLLCELGEGCVLDQGWVQPHVYSGHSLHLDRVSVGAHAELGEYACALLGSTVGAGAKLEAKSLLLRGDEIPAGSVWAGVPASVQV